MRALAACLLAAMLWWGPARADDAAPAAAPVSAADRQAIEQVISSQLDAFRHDAGEAAFSYASPKIRSMFRDAPNFMAMVRQGYPPVYRPRSFTFEQLTAVDDQIIQRVTIIGPDGSPAVALYALEREPDGTWRIDGCTLLRPEGLTT